MNVLSQVIVCDKRNAPWVVHLFTTHVYYNTYFTFKAICVNLVPCAMLVLLNILLFRALKRAQLKKRKLFKDDTTHPAVGLLSQSTLRPPPASRRHSSLSSSTTAECSKKGTLLFHVLKCTRRHSEGQPLRRSRPRGDSDPTGEVATAMAVHSGLVVASKGCRSDSHGGTTLMLIVVVTVFLATEIPNTAAVILHVLNNNFHLRISYDALNALMVVVNFFFMISYPLNFAIYCGMSKQFRNTFRELFVTGWLRSPGEGICRLAPAASSTVAMNGGGGHTAATTQRTIETVL